MGGYIVEISKVLLYRCELRNLEIKRDERFRELN